MDSTVPYLRTQSELLTELGVKMRDTGHTRWTSAEKYAALNEVLMTWHEMVRFPHIYTISGGWVASTYDYALPAYVRPPVHPQLLRRLPYDEFFVESTTSSWQDIPGWEVEPDGSGASVLRLYAPPRTLEGRVLFYAPNSRVPTGTLPTTSGSTAADATTMLLGSAIDVDDTGYVKVNAEYMMYAGVTRAAAATTLLNLVRALNGSSAAIQATASTVTWCVAMDTLSLDSLLFNQWMSYMHAYFLQDGGVHERANHEKSMGWYQQMADAFWPSYRPIRKSSGLTLSRRALSLR